MKAKSKNITQLILVHIVILQAILHSFNCEVIIDWEDETNDEFGVYPKDSSFAPHKGLFDITNFKVESVDDSVDSTSLYSFTFNTKITNPENAPLGFTHQYIQLYIQGSEFPSSWRIKPTYSFFSNVTLDNPNIAFERYFNWNLLLSINGWESKIIFPSGVELKIKPTLSNDDRTISVEIPNILGPPQYYWNFVLLSSAFDFNNYNNTGRGFREHKYEATQWEFGGGSDGNFDPNVVDILNFPNSAKTSTNILYNYCTPQHNYTVITPVSLLTSPYAKIPENAPLNGDLKPDLIDPENGNFCSDSLLSRSPAFRYLFHSTVFSSKERVEVLLSIDPDLNLDGSDNHLNQYGIDIPVLKVTVDISNPHYFHFIIDDYAKPRTPSYLNLNFDQINSNDNDIEPLYEWEYSTSPFGIIVRRKDTKEEIFNTAPYLMSSNTLNPSYSFRNLVFKEQYMEISTSIPPSADLYGLGERIDGLQLDRTTGRVYSIFNIDQGNPMYENLYGTHPFYIEMRDTESHGVFINNIMGLDVSLNEQFATFRFIGGLIDIYVFPGSNMSFNNKNNFETTLRKNSKDVLKQYHQLIGTPKLPPYWALGYHQSRWGYNTVEILQGVVKDFTANHLPLESVWSDIDYMDDYKLFTVDEEKFPLDKMDTFISDLHANNQRYVVIIDPGVRVEPGYAPYDQAIKENLFIMDSNRTAPALGKVWPGPVHFIDYCNPKAYDYWLSNIKKFHNSIAFDSLWLDMNEPASFCDGHCTLTLDSEEWDLKWYQFNCKCPPPVFDNTPTHSIELLTDFNILYQSSSFNYSSKFSTLNFPPYKIAGINPDVSTISMDSVHYNGLLEIEVHNLFGHLEGKASALAMEEINNERGFVLSRSTIATSGRYITHWLGDNISSWLDLQISIPGVLSMNLFGIPMVGADICGFNYNVTEELCARWIQLGAIGYTIARNHNTYVTIPQEPYALGDVVLDVSRAALYLRYSLLPYYYSILFEVEKQGGTVLTPLFLEFPTDHICRSIDDQLLIGSGLLFAPVIKESQTSRPTYFPNAHWFDYFTGRLISSSAGYIDIEIESIKQMLLFIKGGTIIPTQPFTSPLNSTNRLTTTEAKRNPFNLVVALTPSNQSLELPDIEYYYYFEYYEDDMDSDVPYAIATGELYFDDGISLDNSDYSHWNLRSIFYWEYNYGVVDISIDKFDFHNYNPSEVYWNNVTIYGVQSYTNLVMINNSVPITSFDYDRNSKVLSIYNLNQPLANSFSIYWGFTPPDQSVTEKFVIIFSGILLTVSILTFFTISYYYCTRRLESFFFFRRFKHLVIDEFDGEQAVEMEVYNQSPLNSPEVNLE